MAMSQDLRFHVHLFCHLFHLKVDDFFPIFCFGQVRSEDVPCGFRTAKLKAQSHSKSQSCFPKVVHSHESGSESGNPS